MSQSSSWSGSRLIFSRVVAWTTVPVFTAGMCILIWLQNQVGLPIDSQDILLALGFAAFALVGSVLVAKRPNNPIGWIMVTIGLVSGLFPAAESYTAYIMTTRGSPDSLAVLGAWFNDIYFAPLVVLAFIYLPLLFPDGRLPSPRWLPVAIIPGVATAAYVLMSAFRETLVGQKIAYTIHNPIGIKGLPATENHPLFIFILIMFGIGIVGAAAAVFVRFRRSGGVERQQLKMFLYTTAFLPIIVVPIPLPLVGDLLFGLIMIALPTAIGVAVLRYRLYDIDIIIRKTLVYAILTAVLALVYFVSVVLLQMSFRTLAANESPLAVVASTLIIAALFIPVRRRVQSAIDSRFYRRKYDAARTVEAFSAHLRDVVDLNTLCEELVLVVDETMQPENVSLWLRPIKQ